MKTFVNYGYDLAKSLESPKRPLTKKEKIRAKLGKDDEIYTTVLRDVSKDELRVWPNEVKVFFNQFARRKAKFS